MHRAQRQSSRAAGKGSLCCSGELRLFYSTLYTGESWAPRSDITLWIRNLISTFSPTIVQSRTAKSSQGIGTVEQLGQDISCPHLHPRAGAIPHPFTHRSCQKRADVSGVLTQTSRPTEGTSSSQKHQDQLTSEITRW